MKRSGTILTLLVILLFALTTAPAYAKTPTVTLDGKPLIFDVPPVIENGRTLVPMRAVFEALGAEVDWDGGSKTVIARKDGLEIKLVVGGRATKNGQQITLDVPARIVNERTMVPLRFVSESMGCKVDWNGNTKTVVITSSGNVSVSQVTQKSYNVKLASGNKPVKVIHVNLKDWEIKPVMARNTVGATESLSDMANRAGAVAAINGTFFNSYSDNQPQGNLQIDKHMYHSGTSGTTVGITTDNKVRFEQLFTGIQGSINGSYEWPNNWYAWGINHVYSDADAIAIFTPAKGKTAGSNSATSIIVKNGVVIQKSKGVVTIPSDGFVITANRGSAAQKVADLFKTGDRVSYRFDYKSGRNGPAVNWDNVKHALGAGPRLLTGGKITVDFAKEGFTDPKITTNRALRSFIGVDKSGNVVIGTVGDVTIKELAEVTQNMGLTDAMNLDGGASSGLFYRGSYLTKPGRLLSNSLVVVKRTGLPGTKASDVGTKVPSVEKKLSDVELASRYYEEGKKLEQTGDLIQAREKYAAAIKLNGSLTDAHLRLGNLLFKEKDYNNALTHLKAAINLNPKNPAPYETVAWIYYTQGSYYDAIKAFEEYEQVDYNGRAKAYYGIGLCYSSWSLKQYDKAREYFQKAVDADPKGNTGRLATEQLKKLN